MTEEIRVGDSVLARHDGNEVPGVVTEIDGDHILVSLATPYVREHGEQDTEVRCPRSDVTRIADDADSTPQLGG